MLPSVVGGRFRWATEWCIVVWAQLILYCRHEPLSLTRGAAPRTCAEGDGVDKCAWDLLRCSLVPQREVISIKHTLLVLCCQEISEEGQRMKLRWGGKDLIHRAWLWTRAASNDQGRVEQRDALIGELIGSHKQVGPWQASACAKEGNLHSFVWVPVGLK